MNTYQSLTSLLATDVRFVGDTGQLLKNKIVEQALMLDRDLLKLLLSDEVVRKHFFVSIDDMLVFDKVKFQQFVNNKEFLPGSFTAFKNKIGLMTDGFNYLTDSNEVVLAWPYKDCVLEGGQDKDDAKRKEVFWSETLAPDEIDRLLAPKMMTRFTRYDADAEVFVEKIGFNENLIIKGNNLLALSTLRPRYEGKIDLIYIDPPFNKGGNAETFHYNNTFKTSTWLTFMKNRLVEAKKLLTKDGAIVVAIDEDEMLTLGMLLKEVFNNCETHCITIVHNPGGKQGTNFSYTNEYAFFVFPQGLKRIANRKLDSNEIEFEHLRNWGGESLRTDAKNCFYPIILDKNGKIVDFGEVLDDVDHPPQTEFIDNKYYVHPIDSKGIERKWRYARQSVEGIKHLLKAEKVDGGYEIKLGKDFGQYKTVWTGKKYDSSTYGTKLVKKLVPGCTFSFPKSLWNVHDCLRAVVGNNKDAIVLDYHAGSGTTAHALLLLNKEDSGSRKFILCEQMDYIKSVTAERVKAVLKTEEISDSFIYCELAESNQIFINEIQDAENKNTLDSIWSNMKERAFLSYQVNLASIDENAKEFNELEIVDQKKFLIEILDKNMLYIPYSEIDDETYDVSETDKALNKQFFG